MARPRAGSRVDDDPATRDGLTLLETWGYSASSAADGKTALNSAKGPLPSDDLMMPGMNGIEFIEGLREQVQQMAVVMMTGQATSRGSPSSSVPMIISDRRAGELRAFSKGLQTSRWRAGGCCQN
jgi:CheY-like chemotaxis protein